MTGDTIRSRGDQFRLLEDAQSGTIRILVCALGGIGVVAAPIVYALGVWDFGMMLVWVTMIATLLVVFVFSLRGWSRGTVQLDQQGFTVKTMGSVDRYRWSDTSDIGLTRSSGMGFARSESGNLQVEVKLLKPRRFSPFGGSGSDNLGIPFPFANVVILQVDRPDELVAKARDFVSESKSALGGTAHE